jgi:hypothetical protein
MENFYKAYTKDVHGVIHYFVKKFISFSEYPTMPDILDRFGMHQSFDRACELAGIHEVEIREKLKKELEDQQAQGKVIPLNFGTGKREIK